MLGEENDQHGIPPGAVVAVDDERALNGGEALGVLGEDGAEVAAEVAANDEAEEAQGEGGDGGNLGFCWVPRHAVMLRRCVRGVRGAAPGYHGYFRC